VIEELAQTNREEKIAEQGMVQAGEEQGARGLICQGKKESADHAKAYGQPVSEDDVDETEGYRAGEEHAPAAAEQRLIAMEEKSPVEELLWVDREQWIEAENEQPECWGTLDQ